MLKGIRDIYFAILLFCTDYFSSVKRIIIEKAKMLKIKNKEQTKIRNWFVNHPFKPVLLLIILTSLIYTKAWKRLYIPKLNIELNQSFYIMRDGILGLAIGLIAFIVLGIVIGILYLLIAALFEKEN